MREALQSWYARDAGPRTSLAQGMEILDPSMSAFRQLIANLVRFTSSHTLSEKRYTFRVRRISYDLRDVLDKRPLVEKCVQ